MKILPPELLEELMDGRMDDQTDTTEIKFALAQASKD
jgi:hypothetical protein